ncbi:O-antigen ligase family protein [Neobacillus drentensis]|uniref:O-antigen ligase family protein n=1 Tax=Neobacillus drentensis TaxID=220684 RepID=UPI002FFDAA5C
MKISKTQLIYLGLILCILLQNSFFHLINPSSTMTLLLLLDIAVLFLLSLTTRAYGAGKYLNKYLLMVIIVVIIPQTIYAITLGETVNGYIDVIRGPFSLFLALPVLVLMVRKNSIEYLLDKVAFLTTISLAILLANSFALNNMGVSLLPFDYFQMPLIKRGDWVRILLISDFLSFTSIYSFCKVLKGKKNRGLFLFSFIICFLSEIYIEQSRVMIMAIAASCLIVFSQTLKRNKIWFYFLAIIFVIIGLFGDWFSSVFEIFSVENEGLGVSTLTRINEISYAIQLIKEHPFMGTGMVHDYYFIVYTNGFSYEYNHTDIGILGCISYIGLIGTIVYFVAPYIRCLKTIKFYSNKNNDSLEYSFMLGILIYVTITALTILIIDNARIFVWPFILAVFEFCRYQYVKNQVNVEGMK